METHLKTKCDRYTSIYGIDYLDNDDYADLKQAEAVQRDLELERFIAQLDTLAGADDFLTDCGDQSEWPGWAA